MTNNMLEQLAIINKDKLPIMEILCEHAKICSYFISNKDNTNCEFYKKHMCSLKK